MGVYDLSVRNYTDKRSKMAEDTQESISRDAAGKLQQYQKNVERVGRMDSEKLLWKSHVYVHNSSCTQDTNRQKKRTEKSIQLASK